MDFVRKYFLWLIVGVVIVGEIGLMVFASIKEDQAQKKIEQLDRLRQQRDSLKAQTRDADKTLALLRKRRENASRELGEALLFLWHRGLAIEGLFDDKRLAPYDVAPGKPAQRMDIFRAVYQTVYNDQVAALGDVMARLETSREALALADPSGFQQASVTIDDIFAFQKHFNITRAFLEVFDRAGAKLRNLKVGPSERERTQEVHTHGREPAAPGVLVDPIPVEFTVEVEYPRLDGMLENLLRSPIAFRLKSLTRVSPATGAAGGAATPPPRAGRRAAEAPSALQAPEEASRRVVVVALGEVEDLCVEVHKVTFKKPPFSDVAAVSGWLAQATAGLNKQKQACERAKDALAGKRVPSKIAEWVRKELARVEQASRPPAEGAEAPKPQPPKPIIIADPLSDPPGREYTFSDPKEAREWLLRRCDLKLEDVAARMELVKRLARALKTSATNPADRTGLVVTFRPLEHFDRKQLFDHALDPKATVVAQLGLVTYKLQTSGSVKRASSTP